MTTVGDKIPADASLSKITLAPNEVLILQLAGDMPDGFMEQVGDLLAHLPRHATILVFDKGVSVASAPEQELRAALAALEAKKTDQRPSACPTCGSPSPRFHPATMDTVFHADFPFEGEAIGLCPDPWHQKT